ncbi:MAG: phosphotransferase, partial [Actinomycetota bacterium]
EGNRATGRSLGIYEREVRSYAEVLPNIDVPAPRVYAAIYEATGDEPKEHNIKKKVDRLPFRVLRWLIRREQGKSYVPPCVLLLEDVDGTVGDQVGGGSLEQIAAGLSTLARCQASTWGGANIPHEHWSEGPEYIPRIIQALYLNGREEFLTQGAPYLSPHSVALYESLAETGVKRVERHRDEVPQAMAHGDFRLDNMFFDPDGSVAAVIDWQTAAPGPVVLDVGYFLVSSLPAETPESVVDELLAGYHAELVANGVDDYPIERFLADYVDGLLIVLHRMTGLADIVDFGDGRGVDLMALWFQRLDARLQRVPSSHLATR